MSVKTKGLGRGFESLIPTQMLEEEFDPTIREDEQVSELRNIPLKDILANPDQPRRHFEAKALEELAASIKEHGVLQPIVVTPNGTNFEIVAGERRWRAAQAAGLEKIPALVRTLSAQHKLEIALIENLQRTDLSILETATAYLKLHQQFNMNYEEIGTRVGKGMSTIGNIIRLLSLPKEAKKALVEGEISEGHARQILAIREPEEQLEFLRLMVKNQWTVRKCEQYVIGYKEGVKDKKVAVAKTKTENKQTKILGKRLKADVTVRTTARGGQLIIKYKSNDDFERIIKTLLK